MDPIFEFSAAPHLPHSLRPEHYSSAFCHALDNSLSEAAPVNGANSLPQRHADDYVEITEPELAA
jgi:hypothetical protein